MEINELLSHRILLLEDSQDEDGFISDSSFLNTCLPYLNESKLTDSEDYNESYCLIDSLQIKINAYSFNESGERLQLYIVNDETLSPAYPDQDIMISQKQIYDKHFSRAINFIKKAGKNLLEDELQDSSPAKALAVRLGSAEGMEEIDVVEVFLISPTITLETRGEEPAPRRMDFEDETIKVSWTDGSTKRNKEVLVLKRLIDTNFLYEVSVSQGNREPLRVDFSDYFIECIQAAMEKNYESYLCVLPAPLLVDLYKRHSSRMLEKNVRSFLQLRNSVNKGIQDTIRNSPEKFIAYNNGLTITATGKDFRMDGDKLFINSLTDFQIVNGGQTTATIYFSDKAGLDITKVKVMAKINVAGSSSEEELEDLISRISEYSNAQSRVSAVDLRSRNAQLVRLKTLSDSIVTPTGKKWFFERAKGEFNTLIRKNPGNKSKLNKEYPKERRFTKEELAKYFMSWGETPHLVKKGGEKVFRQFIEEISGNGKAQDQQLMDRAFYEETIAKIILFRALEKEHGMGSGAIGQLRSAVVPYTLSVIYKYTTGDKYNHPFKLAEIWKKEGPDDHLLRLGKSLMILINKLIKKYAESDDYGEYSKKPELWNEIKASPEIRQFTREDAFQKVIRRYCSPPANAAKANGPRSSKNEINFTTLYNSISFFAADEKEEQSLTKAADFIVKKYNSFVGNGQNVTLEFSAIRKQATAKGAKDAVIFSKIGKLLSEGTAPDFEQIKKASNYTNMIK